MSRSRLLVASALAAWLMALPATPRAAVEGGPHDLVNQGYVPSKGTTTPSKCSYCHLPMLSGDKLPLEEPPPSVKGYGRIGLVCYSCHDGTTIVDRNVDASRSAFHPDAHPLRLGDLSLPKPKAGEAELPVKEDRMECTTCHVPHDNAVRPFLRVEIMELCLVCHVGRDSLGYGSENLTGTHPIHETMGDDAGNKSPISPLPAFTTTFPDPYPLTDGKIAPKVHWLRGGHLSLGENGTMECFTCHVVHGGERNPPMPRLLAAPPVRVMADEFCEGCHRGERGDELKSRFFPNPGGTTTGRTYHPCDDDISNGTDRKPDIRPEVSWPFGSDPSKPLLCTTCHVAHGGMERSPLLRNPTKPGGNFCDECHIPEDLIFHHPVSPNPPKRKCVQPPGEPLWGGVKDILYCSSCHVAHNAGYGRIEADYIPILKWSARSEELCGKCHPPDNPTCEEKGGTVSHFLGNPLLKETYNDVTPPIRTTPWPQTKLESRYGGDEKKSIICLSCHSFQLNTASGLVKPLRGYLVAPGGNDVEWEADQGVYLCTGCHGENPATKSAGHTHPLMNAKVEALGKPATPPVSYTVNGHMNCDSCHRAHGAVLEGGYYILESVLGNNKNPKTIHPSIDYTVLCHLCHTSY